MFRRISKYEWLGSKINYKFLQQLQEKQNTEKSSCTVITVISESGTETTLGITLDCFRSVNSVLSWQQSKTSTGPQEILLFKKKKKKGTTKNKKNQSNKSILCTASSNNLLELKTVQRRTTMVFSHTKQFPCRDIEQAQEFMRYELKMSGRI